MPGQYGVALSRKTGMGDTLLQWESVVEATSLVQGPVSSPVDGGASLLREVLQKDWTIGCL